MKKLRYLPIALILAIVMLAAACVPGSDSAAQTAAPPLGKAPVGVSKPAWEQKWDATLAEAKKEGKVAIYGQVGPELRDELTTAVRKEFGLDLEFTVGKGAEVSTKFLAEAQAGVYNADLTLWGASTYILITKPKGTMANIAPLLIRPDATDPSAWRDGKPPFIDKDNMVIPLVSEVNQLLLVNTDMVKPGELNSFRDLLQPRWKGKIVMYDPTIGGTSNTWVTLLLTRGYGPVEGENYLRQYVTQEPMITKDSRLQIEWLARGRYPVCVAVDTQAAYSMQKNGAPITRLKTEEGGILTGGGAYMGIPTNRPHPNATTVLVNWLLGPAGQLSFSKGYMGPPSRLGVAMEGASPLSLALPGEKLYQQDEEMVLAKDNAQEVARKIFAPLLK